MIPRIIKLCAICGKEMVLLPSQENYRKTCSYTCKGLAQIRRTEMARVNLSEEKKAEIVEMILNPPRSNWTANTSIARATGVSTAQVASIRSGLEKFMEKK